jgi:hypothetical protein
VRRLHFNASGEGKRSEIDGHMRSGEPAVYVTPDPEAHIQLDSGDNPDPILSSWIWIMRTKPKSEVGGIQSFRDFKLHKNKNVTTWKSSGVGPGKRISKRELEEKYARP